MKEGNKTIVSTDTAMNALGIENSLLDQAIEAVNQIFIDSGASIRVSAITVSGPPEGRAIENCKCLRYETRCYSIMEYDPITKQYRKVTQCERVCAEQECET